MLIPSCSWSTAAGKESGATGRFRRMRGGWSRLQLKRGFTRRERHPATPRLAGTPDHGQRQSNPRSAGDRCHGAIPASIAAENSAALGELRRCSQFDPHSVDAVRTTAQTRQVHRRLLASDSDLNRYITGVSWRPIGGRTSRCQFLLQPPPVHEATLERVRIGRTLPPAMSLRRRQKRS